MHSICLLNLNRMSGNNRNYGYLLTLLPLLCYLLFIANISLGKHAKGIKHVLLSEYQPLCIHSNLEYARLFIPLNIHYQFINLSIHLFLSE